MRGALGLVLFLAAACASMPVVEDGAQAALILPGVHHGANTYQNPLPAELAAHLCGWGGDVTLRTPQLSQDGLRAFMASLPCASLHVLALVEAPDVVLAASLAAVPVRAIENGNELELDPHQLTPEQYAERQESMSAVERAAGFTGDLIMGGVYDLTDQTKRAIQLAKPRCPTCQCGAHLYNPTQSDVDWMNAQDCEWAITETGSQTGCGTEKWQAQADYVAGVRALIAGVHRLKYFIVYAQQSGPTCSTLDTFGFRDFDRVNNKIEGPWKILEGYLAQWVKE